MIWIPFVTFWQVAMDMLEPVDVAPGHGHSYTLEFVDGWAAVIQPPGWTAERADALRSIIARGDRHERDTAPLRRFDGSSRWPDGSARTSGAGSGAI